ncbi:unnamed protein product, partial [Phaeothamnion confervicola]
MSSRGSDTDEDWEDWEADEGSIPAQSLFCAETFATVEEALAHDRETYGFDLKGLCNELAGFDFYGAVKLINLVRSQVSALRESSQVPTLAWAQAVVEGLRSGQLVVRGEEHLRPFLADDAILMALGSIIAEATAEPGTSAAGAEDDDDEDGGGDFEGVSGVVAEGTRPWNATPSVANSTGVAAAAFGPGSTPGAALVLGEDSGGDYAAASAPAAARTLRAENEALRLEVAALRTKLERSKRLLGAFTAEEAGGGSDSGSDDGGNDASYFRGYSHLGIHETMLRDSVRTGGYKWAIMNNRRLFKGKPVVLDVGCGTGVLSMFAARAGAARVIGVDMSDAVLHARRIVHANGLQDVVTLLQGKMEEVKLPVERVDIIVSEWMGFGLLFETMLPSVLIARDRYLTRPGGLVLPDATPLFVEGVRDPEGRLDWWRNVHGLDYTCIQEEALRDASVELVPPEWVVTQRCKVRDFDPYTLKERDLDFEAPFCLVATSAGELSAFALSFDVGFLSVWAGSAVDGDGGSADQPSEGEESSAAATGAAVGAAAGAAGAAGAAATGGEEAADSEEEGPKEGPPGPVWFSTGTAATPTHWKQTVLWLAPAERPMLAEGGAVTGMLRLRRGCRNQRELDIGLEWAVAGRNAAEEGESGTPC